MKFLDGVGPNQEVLPLNYLYFNERNFNVDDVLTIIYKDVASGETKVQNIIKPEIEVWIVKPEYREAVRFNRTWVKKEYLEPHKVRYRNRYRQIAKILGLQDEDIDLAKTSPFVLFSNLDIRNYYALQFIHEYNVPDSFNLNIGLFDIENDIIDIDHFPQPGECPISLIAFIDVSNETVYQFILEPQNHSNTINPATGDYYDYRDQVQHLKEHVKEYIQELHEMFDESYGVLEYHILFLKSEEEMISKFFKLLDVLNIDFAEAWNAAYDMSNLTSRPDKILSDPIQLICSDKFLAKECLFVEDKNPLFHKRKHTCQIAHPTVFIDQMVIYAGLRSAMGKIPSLKLNVIAQKEIGDTKLDYSEEGSIKELPYENFWKYCLYSIKDTLLQLGIHRKTDDISSVYSRMLEDGLLANEVFTSTIQLTNSLSTFLLEHDYIPGNNFNKFNDEQKLKQQAYFYGSGNDIASDENDAMMNAMVDPDDLVDTSDDEEEEDDSSSKKKKKFSGAMVQDPNRMLPTGFKINGRLNSRIHNNVGDMDITSEYPTAIILSNMSSETLIARVEFVDDLYDWIYVNKGPKWIEEHRIVNNAIRFTAEDMMDYRFNRLPMYNYDFIDEDAAKYKLNMSDTITMLMAFDDVVHIGTQFCNLPDYDELVRNNMVITRKKSA
jgi:hypothetical protein